MKKTVGLSVVGLFLVSVSCGYGQIVHSPTSGINIGIQGNTSGDLGDLGGLTGDGGDLDTPTEIPGSGGDSGDLGDLGDILGDLDDDTLSTLGDILGGVVNDGGDIPGIEELPQDGDSDGGLTEDELKQLKELEIRGSRKSPAIAFLTKCFGRNIMLGLKALKEGKTVTARLQSNISMKDIGFLARKGKKMAITLKGKTLKVQSAGKSKQGIAIRNLTKNNALAVTNLKTKKTSSGQVRKTAQGVLVAPGRTTNKRLVAPRRTTNKR